MSPKSDTQAQQPSKSRCDEGTEEGSSDKPVTAKHEKRARHKFIEELYKSCRSDLVGWLRQRYGAGPPEPEDIAQTAFSKLAAMKDVENIRYPKSFLYATAINASIETVRWLERTRRFIDHEIHSRGGELEEISPESVSLAQEQLEVVVQRMEGLSDKQREIVVRSRFLGQTYQEITAETGWSQADISRQLKAALIAMRKVIKIYKAETE